MADLRRRRDQRGLAFPSPLVMLSVIAVAMAGIAFVATGDREPQEQRIETVSDPAVAPSAEPTVEAAPEPTPEKPEKKTVDRGKTYVEVYNNSGVKGLAGETAAKISGAGWQVVGADNWYGNVPASTVYHPPRLARAAKQLALDLGIDRVQPAVSPMKLDRLTVILTG